MQDARDVYDLLDVLGAECVIAVRGGTLRSAGKASSCDGS